MKRLLVVAAVLSCQGCTRLTYQAGYNDAYAQFDKIDRGILPSPYWMGVLNGLKDKAAEYNAAKLPNKF